MYNIGTTFKIENKEEYLALMKHLEDIGYLWESRDTPTHYNNSQSYYSRNYVCIPNTNRICCGVGTGTLIHATRFLNNTPLKRPSLFKGNKNV